MKAIHKYTGRILPYLIYLAITTVTFDITIISAYFFNVDTRALLIPDVVRVVNIIPTILSASGLFGLVPDAFLSKKKKANIFYFVNSNSFREFMVFWIFVALIQGIFYVINTYLANKPGIILHAFDIATVTASFVCLVITVSLFLSLFYSRR